MKDENKVILMCILAVSSPFIGVGIACLLSPLMDLIMKMLGVIL